jgi:threonine aldolase
MIDLRSDTVTRPSEGMRRAMAAAEVGDDVFGEDPTVNRLQEVAAERMGKEAALFLPSGTMANLCAFMAQSRSGDSVILAESAHPHHYEGGNMAAFGGLLAKPLPHQLGKITAQQVLENIVRIDDVHCSQTAVVAIENTTNRGGGAFYTTEEVGAIAVACHARGVRLHCDGARLFNAAIAQEVSAAALCAGCDTVSFCLSKGLGAPVGSLLAGDRATIRRAHQLRKMLGGGMRQAGVLAAAGLYALEHHVEPLREDHAKAARFRSALEAVGCPFPVPSPTNIVYISVDDAPAVVRGMAAAGVLIMDLHPKAVRVVFHRDISEPEVDCAIDAFVGLLRS